MSRHRVLLSAVAALVDHRAAAQVNGRAWWLIDNRASREVGAALAGVTALNPSEMHSGVGRLSDGGAR